MYMYMYIIVHVHVHYCTCIFLCIFTYMYCMYFPMILIPTDEEVRECVLLSLDEKFDTHLAQAENLTSLFIAIYDGVSIFNDTFMYMYKK